MGIIDSFPAQVQQTFDQARLPIQAKLEMFESAVGDLGNNITGSIGAAASGSPPIAPVNADQAGSSAGKIDFTPANNPLNAFDQSSYSIRFSLLSDVPGNNSEVVIAETGKTNLYIESLQIKSTPARTSKTRNTVANEFNMRIFEPMGSNLPDMLIAAAKSLYTKNYMRGPWKITIKFDGYDPVTGQINPNILDRDWSWTVQLIEMKSRVNDSGSHHDLNFAVQNETGYYDQIVKLPENIQVVYSVDDTIGAVLDRIIKSMNIIMRRNYNPAWIEYSISQVPYKVPIGGVANPFDNKFDISNPLFKSSRSTSVTISGGTSLMVAIDTLFAASQTAAAMAAAASRDHDNNPYTNKEVVSVFYAVESKVTLGEYIDTIGEYNRKIEYIVHPYETVNVITNGQAALEIDNVATNTKKASFLVNNKYLGKLYDYIFTGKNTEVLKFDIDLNFMWSMIEDMRSGDVHYDQTTVPAALNPVALARTNDSTNPNQPPANSASVNSTAPTGTASETLSSSQQGSTTTSGARQTTTEKLSATSGITYVDDLQYLNRDTFSITPITRIQQSNSNRVQTSNFVPGDFTKQRSMYGMLLSQVYGKTLAQGSLYDLALEIRGDPYWLGTDLSDSKIVAPSSNTLASTQKASSTISQQTAGSKEYPEYLTGDYVFIFRFNTPQGYDENTGSVSLKQNEMYTGFYSLYEVEHNFKDGSFTQSLHATKIPGMKLDNTVNIVGA